MELFHATPRPNVPSIRAGGLDPAKSKGARPVVWLATWGRINWLLKHISKHQGCEPSDLALLTVNVPRNQLTRRRRGVYTTERTVKVEVVYGG